MPKKGKKIKDSFPKGPVASSEPEPLNEIKVNVPKRPTLPTKIKVYPLDHKLPLNDPNRPNKDEYEVKENLPHLSYNQPQTGPYGGYNHYEVYHAQNIKDFVERSGIKDSFAKIVGVYNKNVEEEQKLLQYVEDLKEDLDSFKKSNQSIEDKIRSSDFSSDDKAFDVKRKATNAPITSIEPIKEKFVSIEKILEKSLKDSGHTIDVLYDPNNQKWYGDYKPHINKLTFPITTPKTMYATGYWSKGGPGFGGYKNYTNVNAFLAFDPFVNELLKSNKEVKEGVEQTSSLKTNLLQEITQEMERHIKLLLDYKDRKPIVPQPKVEDSIGDDVSVINIDKQRDINDDLLSKYGDNKSVLDLKEALTNKAQPKLTQQQYLDVSASRLKDETQQQSAIDFSVIQQQNIEDKKQDQSVNAIRDLKSALDSTRYIALFDAANRLKHAKKVYKSRPVVYQYTAPSRIKPKELDLRARFNLMID